MEPFPADNGKAAGRNSSSLAETETVVHAHIHTYVHLRVTFWPHLHVCGMKEIQAPYREAQSKPRIQPKLAGR